MLTFCIKEIYHIELTVGEGSNITVRENDKSKEIR